MRRGFYGKDSELLPYFFLAVLCFLLYLPVIISGQTTLVPSYQDLTQWSIYREFVKQSFSAGYFSLWCEGLFSGLDFAGWGHGSAFYPLAFFFFFLEFSRAVVFNQLLHLLVGVWGFYFLARKAGLKKSSALLSAGGFGMVFLVPGMVEDFLPEIFVRSYLGFVYGFSLELVRRFRKRDFSALSVCIALQVLSGHHEVVALEYLSLMVFLAVFLLLEKSPARHKFRGVALWVLAVAFGNLLGMVAFLPTLASYGQSFRQLPLSYGLFTLFPSKTLYLESLPGFLPMLSVVFIFALVFSLKSRCALFWALAIMFWFTLAESYNWLGLLKLLYHLPVFSRFIPHGRALSQAMLALFLLLGRGLDRRVSLTERRLGWLLVALLFLLEGVLFYGLQNRLGLYLAGMTAEFKPALAHFILSRQVLAAAIFGLGLAVLLFGLTRRLRTIKPCSWLGAGLLLEFVLTGYLLVPSNRPELTAPHPEYLDFLSRISPAEYRVQSVYSFDQWEKLKMPLQTGVLFGTRSPDAYITFSTLRYTEFLKLLDEKAFRVEDGKVLDVETPNILKRGDFVSLEKLPLINLLNLKYFITQNKNLQAGQSFFPGYELYRFEPKLNVSRGGSFKELAVEPPSRFGLRVFIKQGDELVVDFKNERAEKSGLIFKLAFSGEILGEQMLAEKRVDSNDSFKISLEGVKNQTGNLVFVVLPEKEQDKVSGQRIFVRIENPSKYFRLFKVGELDIYENPGALPRAFLVHGVRVMPEKEARLAYLGSPDFEPSRTAVLEKEPWLPFPQKLAALQGESVKMVSADDVSGSLSLLVTNLGPGILVCSESWYPGFRAWLDGKETRLFPADHAFRGVLLPSAGVHRLEMKYQPAGFGLALWTGIATFAVWLIFSARRQRDTIEESN